LVFLLLLHSTFLSSSLFTASKRFSNRCLEIPLWFLSWSLGLSSLFSPFFILVLSSPLSSFLIFIFSCLYLCLFFVFCLCLYPYLFFCRP
jgi:hypothetical protein